MIVYMYVRKYILLNEIQIKKHVLLKQYIPTYLLLASLGFTARLCKKIVFVS